MKVFVILSGWSSFLKLSESVCRRSSFVLCGILFRTLTIGNKLSEMMCEEGYSTPNGRLVGGLEDYLPRTEGEEAKKKIKCSEDLGKYL